MVTSLICTTCSHHHLSALLYSTQPFMLKQNSKSTRELSKNDSTSISPLLLHAHNTSPPAHAHILTHHTAIRTREPERQEGGGRPRARQSTWKSSRARRLPLLSSLSHSPWPCRRPWPLSSLHQGSVHACDCIPNISVSNATRKGYS